MNAPQPKQQTIEGLMLEVREAMDFITSAFKQLAYHDAQLSNQLNQTKPAPEGAEGNQNDSDN